MAEAALPRYADLKRLPNGLRSAWGVFGADDELGTANLLTGDAVIAASTEILTGERINVTLPLNEPNPAFFGRRPYQHTPFAVSDSFRDDFVDGFYLQGSTNWDGFRHKRDPLVGFYNGIQPDGVVPAGDRLGFASQADNGIIGRGVLVDVARNGGIDGYDPLEPFAISPEDLERTILRQGVAVQRGDILMVRTGYMDSFLAAGSAERERIRDRALFAGLAADETVAEYLWDNHLAAVAVDNPGVEYMPEVIPTPDLHALLIPMLGMIIGEFFDFRELSDACDSDRRYTSMFVSVPLNLPGSVGSPGNAVVIR
jgi:kynurenine formamidase